MNAFTFLQGLNFEDLLKKIYSYTRRNFNIIIAICQCLLINFRVCYEHVINFYYVFVSTATYISNISFNLRPT